MTSSAFEDREKAAENRHAREEDARFRVNARAVKLFGLWAAAQLGHAEAEAYAAAVVESDFEEGGHHDVIRKVKKDFDARGVAVTEHHLENQFQLHVQEARKALG
jgi:hypothetical protein